MKREIAGLAKKVLSVLLSLTVVVSTFIVSGVEIFNTDVSAYNSVANYPDFSVNKYLADLMTDPNDSMCTALELKMTQDAPSTILAAEFNKNDLFLDEVTEWKVATFKPNNAVDGTIKETDYYEVLILNSLKVYYSNSQVKNTFDNEYIKSAKSLFNNFKSALKTGYSIEFNTDLSNEEIKKIGEAKILDSFSDSFKKTYPNIKMVDDFINDFDICIKVGKSLEQSLNNIAAYYQCCKMDDSMKQLVLDMKNSYSGDNLFLKEALLKISTACKSETMAFDVATYDMSKRLFAVALDYVLDELFKNLLSSSSLTSGMLLGQSIGKNTADFLFSTSETIEQYFKISGFSEVETLIRDVTQKYMDIYRADPTDENAEKLFAAVDVLYTNYNIGCEMAQKMADIVFRDNNYKRIVSLIIPQYDEGYNNFTIAVSKMKQTNEEEYQYLRGSGFLQRFEDDYPDIYKEFIVAGSYDTDFEYVPIESIAFQQDSVEWGLDDTWLINDDLIINPSNATNHNIVYTSSDPSVVTRTDFGFSVHKAGTATITAKAVENGMTATLNVTVVERNGKDGVKFEDVDFESSIKYGEEFTVGNNTYSVLSVGDSYGTVGIKYGKPNNLGIIYVPERVCYKNKLFTVTQVLNGKSQGTGAARGAFTNGGSYMLWNTNVKKIILPSTIKYIGLFAFNYLMELKSLEIPEGVEGISDAFSFCGIEKITLPQSLNSLYISPVYNYEQYFKLKDIYYYGTKENWEFLSRFSDLKNATVHILHVHRYSSAVTKKSTCSSFGEITWTCVCGDTYTENIDMLPHEYSEEWTVDIEPTYDSSGEKSHHCKNCDSRTDITIIPKIAQSQFKYVDNDNGGITITKYIGDYSKVIIPSQIDDKPVTAIGEKAFIQYEKLESITMPDSIKYIGKFSFAYCDNLIDVNLSNNLESIDEAAFYGCINLTKIIIPASTKEIAGFVEYGLTYMGVEVFGDCTKLENIIIDQNNSIYASYDGIVLSKDKKYIKYIPIGKSGELQVPYGVISLGDEFSYHTNITSIRIPETVTNVEYKAFCGCENLNNITISNGITNIGIDAFLGCTSLTSIIIPNSVKSIGSEAFWNCISLTSITIPESVKSIGYEAFGYYYDYDRLEEEIIKDFTIYGKKGTAAEKYAKENGFEFVSVEDTEPTPSEIVATSVKFNTTSITLEKGKTATLTATVTPDNATDKTITWSTSNSKVASVDKNGKVTAVGEGTAIITATTANGKTATCKVTVKNPTVALKTVTLKTTSYIYTGTAKKPAVTVTDANGKTVASSNYTVTYTNNIKTGTATVKVTGKGNYTGTTTKTFKINAKSTSKLTTKLSATSYTYNGKAKTPTVTLKDGTKTLKKGTDYTVTYKNNTKPGKATVTIKGKGNYTGTITKTFTIKPKKATLKTVTSPKTKQLKATWAKDTTVNGYQIQYSTNSKFKSGNKTKTITKNSTTSATITKLTKGKTYYVRVRAYKTVGKTNIYGAYSTVKKVKIK